MIYVQRRGTGLIKLCANLEATACYLGFSRIKWFILIFFPPWRVIFFFFYHFFRSRLKQKQSPPKNLTLLNVIKMGKVTSAALFVAVICVLVLHLLQGQAIKSLLCRLYALLFTFKHCE